ncbi:MAG: YggT family protein [Actinomycetia bacterium]|nr:YggT family protein [Actinomycetes bacterium]
MQLICSLLQLFMLLMFVYIVLSWFPKPYGSTIGKVYDTLGLVVEPVLGPVRRALRPLMGSMPLDFSPMVIMFGLIIIQRVIGCG